MPLDERYVVETIDDKGRLGSRSWLGSREAAKSYTDRLDAHNIDYECFRLDLTDARRNALVS